MIGFGADGVEENRLLGTKRSAMFVVVLVVCPWDPDFDSVDVGFLPDTHGSCMVVGLLRKELGLCTSQTVRA